MSEPISERTYSDGEQGAFRAVAAHAGMGAFKVGRGAPYFATGSYWPDHLRRMARLWRRLAPLAELAADAMEREIARWPADEAPTDPRTPTSTPPETEESA